MYLYFLRWDLRSLRLKLSELLMKCLSAQQKRFLSHSLGNLLPLSRAKNSSLQNDSFVLKKNNGNGVGYYNGSCAENEVGQLEGWNPEEVLSRGLRLLKFIEERWSIALGDENVKRQLLCLDFVKDDIQQI